MLHLALEVLPPAVAMLCREVQTCQALLISTQHEIQHTDRRTGLTRFRHQPGEMYCLAEAGHVPPALHVIYVSGQHPRRLLC